MDNSTKKAAKADNETFLKGSLSSTNITDLLQFLTVSYKSGMLQLHSDQNDRQGEIFFSGSNVINVKAGDFSSLDGFAEILTWKKGTFQFQPDAIPEERNMSLNVQHAIMEAAVLLDERIAREKWKDNPPGKHGTDGTNDERSSEMSKIERDSAEVMNDLLGIPGIDAVVVIGRDGFVIESAGSSTRVNIDELGASLAHAVNGIEEMGGELKVDRFQDMFIEYGKAVILCKPVGDAVAAVITPDASKLGIIRHKTKKHFEELALSF